MTRTRPASRPRPLRALGRALAALGTAALLLSAAGPAAADPHRDRGRGGLRIQLGGSVLQVHGSRHGHAHRRHDGRKWHRGHRDKHRHGHVDRHHRRHRHGHVHRHHRRSRYGHVIRLHRHHVVRSHAATWLCAPCSHRFGSVHTFERHLLHHHRVPRAHFPSSIIQVGFTWIFKG